MRLTAISRAVRELCKGLTRVMFNEERCFHYLVAGSTDFEEKL